MKNANFTPKQKQTIRIVKQALIDNPKGLTLDEINQKTKLSISTIQTTLKILESEIYFDEVEQVYIFITPANDEPTNETAGETDNPVETAQDNCEIAEIPKPHKDKPCTTSKITGYHIKGENVRIFLDKRHNAQSITLSVNDLKDLLKSVKRQGLKNVG